MPLPRCDALECTERAARFQAGRCECGGNYCGSHRLMEDHKCTMIESCRMELFQRNADQLFKERTQVIKMQ